MKPTKDQDMLRCPICRKPPVFDTKPMGSTELWMAGCDTHFKNIAIQPSYEEVLAQWNEVVGQFPQTVSIPESDLHSFERKAA